jgi:hypothetical protein
MHEDVGSVPYTASTLRDNLRREGRFGRIRRPKPLLSAIHVAKRFAWAKDMLELTAGNYPFLMLHLGSWRLNPNATGHYPFLMVHVGSWRLNPNATGHYPFVMVHVWFVEDTHMYLYVL